MPDRNSVSLGDIVQYVWGMPGPDYDEGSVSAMYDNGTFDIAMGPETYGGAKVVGPVRLSDRNAVVGVGYCAKVTRPGINGF